MSFLVLVALLSVIHMAKAANEKLSDTIYRVGIVWGTSADYETLQEFIESGEGRSASDEIWLGAGTHIIKEAWTITKWQSKLYGGFAGNETAIDQRAKNSTRPWDFTNKTTIKLDVNSEGRRSLLFNNMSGGVQPTLTLIDGVTFDGTGCTASVLFLRAFTNDIVLRNCVVEDGNMNVNNTLSGGTDDCIAGGITVGSDDASPTGKLTIDGCLIQNNKGRIGGIFARNVHSIVNSVIRGNESEASTVDSYKNGDGGGIYVVNDLTLFGNIIQGNKSAGNGAAVYLNAPTVIANNVFYNNLEGDEINHVYTNGKYIHFVNNVIDKLPANSSANYNIVHNDITSFFSDTEWWTPIEDFPGKDKGTLEGITNVPTKDFAGNERVVNNIDIGPYEINSYSVSRTSDESVDIDESRSSRDGAYSFGDEYKIYLTVYEGVPIPSVNGSTFSLTKDTESDNDNAYILTIQVQGETTIHLMAGIPYYITPIFDPLVTILEASSFADESHNGDYVVEKEGVFELTFTIPEGYTAVSKAGNQTLYPTITADTIYTIKIDDIKSDFELIITVNTSELPAPIKITTADIDWKTFLAQHDMYWTSFITGYPNGYFSGAIMGNGLLGTNLYKENVNVYRLNVGRTDVTEGRIQHQVEGYGVHSHLYDEARLPIGSFRIQPKGSIKGDTARLSLYDAVTRGIIATDRGRIDYRTYVHATKNYIVWDAITSDSESGYTWAFEPDEAISPRQMMGGSYVAKGNDEKYGQTPNPAVKNNVKDGEYTFCIQPLFTGWTYVVAWKEVKKGNSHRLIATVAYESSEKNAISVAKQTLEDAFETDESAMLKAHTDWWNSYYPSSFVSFDNTDKIEGFYWAQVYKFACATRVDKPIIDIMGPWPVVKTPWPCVWMNLNTQLTYSWLATANRSDLSFPLWNTLNEHKNNLIYNAQNTGTLHYVDGSTKLLNTENDNEVIAMARSTHYGLKTKINPEDYVKNQYEVANMTWLLYYYWQYGVYNQKEEVLKGDFFELLTYSINYYFHIRKKFDSDGKYHLPVTASPEYSSGNIGADVNYDHSAVRWGLQTLLELNDRYNLNSPKRAEWQDFLDNLAPYPVGANGYKISATQEYASSHRHWSHLNQIYPFYLVNWDNPNDRDIISKSVAHWQSKPNLLQGYSYSGSASMYASMGDGELAFTQLNKLISNTTYIRPNTLYYESGNPVFETPMSAAASLQEMYLQSWGGKVRVFHAVPAIWKDASFINLRTEGAFLVSANRRNGKTTFIQVESEVGGLCRLQTGINMAEAVVRNLNGQELEYVLIDAETGLIEVNMSKGEVIQVLNLRSVIKYPCPVIQQPVHTMKFGVNNAPADDAWTWELPLAPEYTGEDVLLDRTDWEIICSSEGVVDDVVAPVGDYPNYIIDGDAKTAFLFVKPGKEHNGVAVPENTEPWFMIDMKKQEEFAYLEYRHRDFNNTTPMLRASKGSFYGRNSDNEAFQPIIENAVIETNIANVRIEFPQKVTYRYVKFIINEWDKNNGKTIQISEFNLGNRVITGLSLPKSDTLGLLRSLYPNPIKAGKPFYIHMDDERSDASIAVYTLSGIKISEYKNGRNIAELKIDIPGVYVVEVKKNGETSVLKTIVN